MAGEKKNGKLLKHLVSSSFSYKNMFYNVEKLTNLFNLILG
jgi:hypothetical protein